MQPEDPQTLSDLIPALQQARDASEDVSICYSPTNGYYIGDRILETDYFLGLAHTDELFKAAAPPEELHTVLCRLFPLPATKPCWNCGHPLRERSILGNWRMCLHCGARQ